VTHLQLAFPQPSIWSFIKEQRRGSAGNFVLMDASNRVVLLKTRQFQKWMIIISMMGLKWVNWCEWTCLQGLSLLSVKRINLFPSVACLYLNGAFDLSLVARAVFQLSTRLIDRVQNKFVVQTVTWLISGLLIIEIR